MSIISRAQLANRLAANALLTPLQAEQALESLGGLITRYAQQGHSVELPGFGLFEAAQRQDKSIGLRFRQAKKVKDALNDSRA